MRRGFGTGRLAGAAANRGPLAGRRSLVLILGSLFVLLFMFQGWVGMPWVDNIPRINADYTSNNGYAIGGYVIVPNSGYVSADAINSIEQSMIRGSYRATDLPGLAGALSTLQTVIPSIYSRASTNQDTATVVMLFNQAVGTLGVASIVLNGIFVLWSICVLGLIVGLSLKLLRGNDTVLFIAVSATGIISLITIIALIVANVQIRDSFNVAFDNGGQLALTTYFGLYVSTVSLSRTILTSLLAPGIGAILSLVASAATAVTSLFMKE